MAYKNAGDLLPEPLLRELQRYAAGELLYIPAIKDKGVKWGSKNGARKQYEKRNSEIRRLRSHMTCEELADKFCLSTDSIRKIVAK